MEMFEKLDGGADILRRLAVQFGSNLNSALSVSAPEINRVELKARCLSSVGLILREHVATDETHREIAAIYDEVFADCVCSLYLAGQGLDKPAQLVLRRVLELGVAAIYLWDVPHDYWGWKQYDKDLSFTEMTDLLSSPQYLQYIASENGQQAVVPIFNVTLARAEYRSLSNTVHGKLATFETSIATRFQHSDADWKSHVVRVEAIQNILLNAAKGRFSIIRDKLPQLQPQLVTIQ